MHISPATHPAFTIRWDAVPKSGDPALPGDAEPNVDFAGTFNNSVIIPEDATIVTASVDLALSLPDETIFRDTLVEGNETFEYEILPDEFDPPPGFKITSNTPTRTIVIVDDDDADAELGSVSDPTVVEGDAGTTQLQFVLTLNQPADGTEQVEVNTADGTATDGDDDYEPIIGQVVTFDFGENTAIVNVTVNGDLADEPDETAHARTLQRQHRAQRHGRRGHHRERRRPSHGCRRDGAEHAGGEHADDDPTGLHDRARQPGQAR